MGNLFRQRLNSGERLMGTMVSLPSLEVIEILTRAGFDWLIIDAGHVLFDDLMA